MKKKTRLYDEDNRHLYYDNKDEGTEKVFKFIAVMAGLTLGVFLALYLGAYYFG